MTGIPEVLFVCVHNAGRSQMAAALLDHHAAGRVRVRSAGSEPADQVNPVVVQVMAELGLDVSRRLPRKLHTEAVAASDVVITMGCGDACPIVPGKRYEDWALPDPAGKGSDEVRAIRDEIDRRVQRLLTELYVGRAASDDGPSGPDRAAIHAELERARTTLHALVATATRSELHRPTQGTRWTNEQLLFHMLFGYMIVRALLGLVRTFGRLPDRFSRIFARVLDSGRRPFHVVNYLGSCGGAMVFRGPRLIAKLDRTIASLHRHLDEETEDALHSGMHFPVSWDPFFRDKMTLLDVYHYGTEHFDFHERQLTLRNPSQ